MANAWITPSDLEDPVHPDAQFAINMASWVLYRLTAEKYPGVGTVTEWYGTDSATCSLSCSSYATMSPLDASGYLRHSHVLMSQSEVSNLRLRRQPALVALAVSEGESELLSSEYTLLNRSYLVKLPLAKRCPWDFRRGVEVTYSYGVQPPVAGQRAAAVLANEFLKAFSGSAECALPDRVTSVSRQGVSYTVLDPQEFIRDGRTGIYEIDLFLQAANPARANKRPKVFSPDIPRGERAV